MFVDLDDAIELDDDENGVFVHFAATCDIEQPSFTSGQHVIALEINHLGRRHSSSNVASTVSIVVDFATSYIFDTRAVSRLSSIGPSFYASAAHEGKRPECHMAD